MPRFGLGAAAAVVGVVAGCGTPATDGEALEGACQFRPCVCADAAAPFWQEPATAPPLWSNRGVPSCPAGFILQRVVEKT